MPKREPERATCIFVLVTLFVGLEGMRTSPEARIEADIFEDYRKQEYPGDVIVLPSVTFSDCPFLDSEGIMSYRITEHYAWNDKRLHWDPSNYDNVEKIQVSLTRLWVPNIKLSASTTVDDVDGLASESSLNAEIDSKGMVSVDRYNRYRTRCYATSEQPETSNGGWACEFKLGSIESYGSETFKMVKSRCNTDMFAAMGDQCRSIVLTRSTSIEPYKVEPTKYWFVVKLQLLKKSSFFWNF